MSAPPALAPGDTLDRYEIVREVAHGGMGTVWLARLRTKHGFEKLVAIKTILGDIAEDIRFRRMFLDEGRIACRLSHANVAQVLDFGEERGVLYLVMEWVEGDSLEHLARAFERVGSRLPVGAILRITADACGGLHHAHELRNENGASLELIHRDISPENLIVSASGNVKIIDFGIAKARGRLAGETSDGRLKGKPSYMAPEYVRGQLVDRRADVWSMGVVLFRLLHGVPPFLTFEDLLAYVQQPRALPGLAPELPEVLAQTLQRALAASVRERFATALSLHATTTSEDIAALVRFVLPTPGGGEPGTAPDAGDAPSVVGTRSDPARVQGPDMEPAAVTRADLPQRTKGDR
jgi:serine/threonine-protein kinase